MNHLNYFLCKNIFFSIILYVVLIILLNDFPEEIKNNGIFKQFFDYSNWVEQKAKITSAQMQESNLALNFLGNLRKLTFSEAKAFQNSGLIHLLAISGGQVVPLANGISKIFSYILFYILYKYINPNKLMIFINHFKIYLSLFISLIICSLFGWTGALVRVSALSYFQSIKFIQSQYFIFFKLFPFLTSKIFHKIFVLFLISSSFGNVFINFSFLLSAIGAIILEISSYITNFLISNLKIFKAICNTILTSFFTGIILYPFTNIDLINSCSANILALPIVCFLITPLSLLAIFIPIHFVFYPYIIYLLDLSLYILKKIAFTFSIDTSKKNPFDKNNPIFTLEGLLYLNTILIILWIFSDFLKERKLFKARNKFLALK